MYGSVCYIYFQKMSDKGSKALRKANKKISTLVSKLNSAIESVNKGNNKITELRTILQRESQNS